MVYRHCAYTCTKIAIFYLMLLLSLIMVHGRDTVPILMLGTEKWIEYPKNVKENVISNFVSF